MGPGAPPGYRYGYSGATRPGSPLNYHYGNGNPGVFVWPPQQVYSGAAATTQLLPTTQVRPLAASETANYGSSRAASVADLAQRRDPFNSLMTVDRDRLDAALETIITAYKSQAGAMVQNSIGFRTIPDSLKYLGVTRAELPVLAEPSLTTDKLTFLGLARAGEYFPVLDEVESTYTLSGPFSRGPSNAGKWCKVQTASGQVGWIFAQPQGIGTRDFATIVQRPAPVQAASTNSDSGGGTALLALIVIGAVVLVLAKAFVNAGRTSAPSWSGGGGSYSVEPDEAASQSWFSQVFHGRTEAKPKQGFFESHADYRDRVYLEGKERIIEDTTGAAPKQGFFEDDDDYQHRVAHEANEAIVEKASGSEPKQGFFESEEDYRERVAHEANEGIVESATGEAPKQGFFESEEDYNDRVAHEANEHIIEEATGSEPKQGFFESDEDYQLRISQEAKDIKASESD